MLLSVAILILSLVLVIKTADIFLNNVEKIGKHFKLSAFLIGVILVGFGTSLPELATSISSIIQGTHNIAIANIIGSNIANILLVLGLSTVFFGTVKFKKDLINQDLPYLFVTTVLFIILVFDGNLSLIDGLVLLIGFVFYLLYSLTSNFPTAKGGLVTTIKSLVTGENREEDIKKNKAKDKEDKIWLNIVYGLGALLVLAIASRIVIDAVLDIASELEIAVEIITFFTIALGTSLPELLVSFKALKQRKGDLVLGNIIGSSIFNILLVGGVASVIHTQLISGDVLFWSLFGLFLATLIILVNGITKSIHAWEGATFTMIYVALIIKLANI